MSHLYAILSDIHGNFQALEAAVKDARETARRENLPQPEFICLGDIVDYGPQPSECLGWVLANVPSQFCLRGNHDDDAGKEGWLKPTRVKSQYHAITMWTRFTLSASERERLRGLPEVARPRNGMGEFLLFHGWPVPGNDTAIEDPGNAGEALMLLNNGRRYGIFGHTHHQMLFSKSNNSNANAVVTFAEPEKDSDKHIRNQNSKPANRWHDLPRRVLLINAGSVGQPRAHLDQIPDPRPGYLLLYGDVSDGWRFQWRRVDYDWNETVRMLKALQWPETYPSSTSNGNDILKEEARRNADLTFREFDETQREHLKQDLRSVIQELVKILEQGK